MNLPESAPPHWERTRFADVFDVLDSRRVPVNATERAGRQGSIPYYGATGQVGTIDDFLFDEELVLLGEDGAPFLDPLKPKAYVIRGKSWVNNHAHVLRVRADQPTDFWKYQLDVVDYCEAVSGTTRLKLPQGSMLKIPVVVPPRPEQTRIVEALDSYLSRLDAAVASLERVQAKLRMYRASVLKAAVEGRLVPTEAELARQEQRDYEPASVLLERILKERRRRWEEAELARLKKAGKAPKDDKWKAKYKEPVAPDTRELPELPEGWCWATLPQLGELNRGKSKHRPRNDARLLGGPYPFIQTGDVKAAETKIRSFGSTYSEFGLAQSRLWPAGTLCITIAANIAETGILGFDACFPDSVVGFQSESELHVRYVELFLRTARQRLEQFAPATAQKNINLETLREVAIPLPPREEQARIVGEVDRVHSIAGATEQEADTGRMRCGRLKQSVLKWAFEGKLVDQDPADEPAGKLLERIRAERAVACDVAKSGRRGRGAGKRSAGGRRQSA